MFKIILLALSVSVVWSTVSATYILHDNSGFEILGHSKFGSFHEPLYQTHLGVEYEDDNHGIVIPQIHGRGIGYFQDSISSFPRIIGESSGFRIPGTRGGALKNTHNYHHGDSNKQTNQNHKISQQQIEVKAVNDNYNQPQTVHQGQHSNSQTDRNILSREIFNHGFNVGSDYSSKYGQSDTAKRVNENSQYISNIQENIQDLQQKFITIRLDQSSESKSENKDNNKDYAKDHHQDYSKDEQTSTGDSKNDQDQKPNQESYDDKSVRFGTNYNSPSYGFQSNEKVYPVLYNGGHLEQGGYFKLHDGNVEGYEVIPSTFGSNGNIYREVGISDGIRYHQDLNSNGGIRVHHGAPILIGNNYHGNLNDHDGILIRLRGDEENIKHILGDSILYGFQENNTSHSEENSSPNYPENNVNNYEQKSVEVGIKSVTEQSSTYTNLGDSGSEYKDIGSVDAPKYSDSGKADVSHNVEQKSLDVPLKSDSGQTSYGITNDKDQQDDDGKYSDNSAINLEQKSIESTSKTEYDVSALKYTPSIDKDSKVDTQQKSVDIAFKSDDAQTEYKTLGGSGAEYPGIGGSGSEYPGIGSIDAPKYPTSNKQSSVSKLEQKSVENGNYQEVKNNFKVSLKALEGYFSSSKTDSDTNAKTYQTPYFEHQEKLSDNKNRGYPTASGVTSTSYFNAGHPLSRNNEHYNRRANTFTYPTSGNSIRSGHTSNNYNGNNGNLPRHTGNYFGSGKPNSFGTTGNYPRFAHSRATNQPYGGPSGVNYQRPNSQISQSYFENSGPKPLVSGVNNRFSHQQSAYNRGSGTPVYSGFSHAPSIPKYHESASGGISAPRYSDSPDIYNKEKFVKVSREYPQKSLKSNENAYQSSTKQPNGIKKPHTGSTVYYQSQNYQPAATRYPSSISDALSASRLNNYSPGTSSSYLKRENTGPSNTGSRYHSNSAGGLDSPSGIDYSKGIGGIEYHGIGESSSQSVVSKSKTYPSPQDTKSLATEQKPYSNDEDTVSEIKSETIYPSGDEYKGIGEIGSTPALKSHVVGGRHPVRKPIKTASVKTKSSPSGVKGKSDNKIEQKYLPITATLSNAKSEASDPKPQKKLYDGQTKTVTASPEKIEQQDLVYEAFLAGEGPQNQARGSSGYVFTRPTVIRGSDEDFYKDEHSQPPMPYEFEYDIKDDEHGSEQYRREKMDNSGYLTGSYGFRDAEGLYRQVEYEASKEGFKVNSIKTNEPGTDNENPADVTFEVQKS